MIVYHGTTLKRARQICAVGFLPKKPSRRVWFAHGKGYAQQRAKTQARRAKDRPIVLTCEIDVTALRARLGPKRVMHRNGIISVGGALPVTVLRSNPGADVPTSPRELSRWLSDVLGIKRHRGPGVRHPGLERLSRWASRRQAAQPRGQVKPGELLELARQWLPEFFEGAEIDPDNLATRRLPATIDVEVVPPAVPEHTVAEEEALACLIAPKARRRARGLRLLGDLEDPDELFNWCVMFLDDDSVEVRVAALETMLLCEDGDPTVIEPLARSASKRIRGAALAALVRHAESEAAGWLERALKDPSPCVRLAVARQLDHLDPLEHRCLFELALYDPNPHVARTAEKLTAGKGYANAAF